MAATPRSASAQRPHLLPWAALRTRAAAALGACGLGAAVGATSWIVLAAAQRPSVLSPPTVRAPHRWLLGPLSGALPHLTADPVRLRADMTAALIVLFVAWLVAWSAADALPLAVVAGVVGLAQLLFVVAPALPLTDVFNYVVYGRMAAHGLNPYRRLPVSVPHDAAYALSNWHHLPSPYGPLFTLLSEPLALLSLPTSFFVWRIVVVACSLASLALVGWLAYRLGRSPQRAVACAGLCPATLVYGVGGFHNDLPAVVCVLGAVAAAVRGADERASTGAAGVAGDAAAGALAVIAAGLKPSFAVAVPLVVLGARRRPAAAAGAAAAGVVVAAVIVVAFGGALPAIRLQDRLVNPLSLPNLLGAAVGRGGADATVRAVARDALAAVVVVASAAVARRRRRMVPVVGLVLLAAVLTLSWVMPWYLAWSLPFAALSTPRALAPLAVVACLWLGVAASPQMPQLVHALGWYPTRSATGHANHELTLRLLR
jgi:Glycosyltransferase family 87